MKLQMRKPRNLYRSNPRNKEAKKDTDELISRRRGTALCKRCGENVKLLAGRELVWLFVLCHTKLRGRRKQLGVQVTGGWW